MEKGSTRAGVTNFIAIIVFLLFSFFYLPFELKLSRHPDSSISNNEME